MIRNKTTPVGRRSGFTLVELAVGLGIFVVLLLSLGLMMANVFRSDRQSQAYERLQNDSVVIVNDLIQKARFSDEAEADVAGTRLTIGIDTTDDGAVDETYVYEVDATTGRLVRTELTSNSSVPLTSESVGVMWKVKVSPGDEGVELIEVRFNLEDEFERKLYDEDKVFALSVRN